jgi:hypothetical protein
MSLQFIFILKNDKYLEKEGLQYNFDDPSAAHNDDEHDPRPRGSWPIELLRFQSDPHMLTAHYTIIMLLSFGPSSRYFSFFSHPKPVALSVRFGSPLPRPLLDRPRRAPWPLPLPPPTSHPSSPPPPLRGGPRSSRSAVFSVHVWWPPPPSPIPRRGRWSARPASSPASATQATSTTARGTM